MQDKHCDCDSGEVLAVKSDTNGKFIEHNEYPKNLL